MVHLHAFLGSAVRLTRMFTICNPLLLVDRPCLCRLASFILAGIIDFLALGYILSKLDRLVYLGESQVFFSVSLSKLTVALIPSRPSSDHTLII
jgi:hypothetical protein